MGQANLEQDLKAIKELKLFFVPGGKHVFLFCKVRHFNTDTMGSALPVAIAFVFHFHSDC